MAVSKKSREQNAGEDAKEREYAYTIGRTEIGTVTVEKVQGFLKTLKTELWYDPATQLLGVYLKKNKNTNLKRHTF